MGQKKRYFNKSILRRNSQRSKREATVREGAEVKVREKREFHLKQEWSIMPNAKERPKR